eukprot:Skav213516  [mRNA]  locus=scaffold656:133368:133655:+ [translate_table: standard]
MAASQCLSTLSGQSLHPVGHPTYYQMLCLGPHAEIDAIKKSNRQLALKRHPDKNNLFAEAMEKFKKLKETCRDQSDPEKCKSSDEELKAPKHRNH